MDRSLRQSQASSTWAQLYLMKVPSLRSGIQAMEMRCYCKILRISYKDHITNEEVCAKIQHTIRPHEDLLTIIKRHKLKWYGHVFCIRHG